MTPNFMISWSGPIEPVAEPSQPTRDLPAPETGKTFHLRHADGREQVDAGIGFDQIGEGGREWVGMLDTRLGNLPGKALGDFSGLGDAAPLRDQTWNVGARSQKTAAGQLLNAKLDRGFVHGPSTRAFCSGSSRTTGCSTHNALYSQ